MILNKNYITQLYNKIEESKKEELDISNIEEFIDYIKAIITSNLQYDFNIDINNEKLFK